MKHALLLALLACLALTAPTSLAEEPTAAELETGSVLDWLWGLVEDLWIDEGDTATTGTETEGEVPGGSDVESGPGADPNG